MKRFLFCAALLGLTSPFALAAPVHSNYAAQAAIPPATSVSAPRTTAIRPRITDAVTGRGIANATVVVCESDTRFTSDARGDLPVLNVPYLEDSRLTPAPYGRLTIIIYADGYRPTVLVDCVTHAHRTRLGPEISLFADEGDSSPVTIVETPPDVWVKGMVEAFPRKK